MQAISCPSSPLPVSAQPLRLVAPEPANASEVTPCRRPTGDEVYRRTAGMVRGLIRRLRVPVADRCDVEQEVFVTVLRRLDDFDPARSLEAWVLGVAWRVGLRQRRVARCGGNARLRSDTIEVEPSGGPNPERVTVARDELRVILDAIPDDRRAVFVMYRLLERSVPDLARALGITESIASSRVRQADADVAKALGRARNAETLRREREGW